MKLTHVKNIIGKIIKEQELKRGGKKPAGPIDEEKLKELIMKEIENDVQDPEEGRNAWILIGAAVLSGLAAYMLCCYDDEE